jgi:uncharacterized membrane protein YheB (UPF0754 family)
MMTIYLLPVIASLIGWFTNFLAIKMLFHPKNPINLGFYTLQGIFPKRQKLLAERLGHVVANNLVHFDDIRKSLDDPSAMSTIHKTIEGHLDTFLQTKLKENFPMLSMFLNDNTTQKIKHVLITEIESILPQIVSNYVDKIENDFDIEKLVSEKVANFSSEKLEELLFAILKKEFRFIEVVGAVLGFLIGLVQVLFVQYL